MPIDMRKDGGGDQRARARLANGSRVGIVGGGPAGSFTAMHLQRFAAQAGLQLEVTVFEARDFNRPGPGGCNKCAGILSSNLVHHLGTLDLHLPPQVIQAELAAYALHLGDHELLLQQPDPGRRIVSVYRGSGPRLGEQPFPHSFDGWLLAQAQARGAILRRERVRNILKGPRPVIVTAHHEFEADLVVVATGINSRSPLDPAWGYRSPRTEAMAQDEIPWPESLPESQVHIFFGPPARLIFGCVIPKGRYANISLLGHALPTDAMAQFLNSHLPGSLPLDQPSALCGCAPSVVVSAAKGYYADRMVVVGDATVTRLYKDGLGSAYRTTEAAALTAVERGISSEDFSAGYSPTCRQINLDNQYGRQLFRLWAIARRVPFLLRSWRAAILREHDLPAAQHVYRQALWGMFTGDESYRQIFHYVTNPAALGGLLQGTMEARRDG